MKFISLCSLFALSGIAYSQDLRFSLQFSAPFGAGSLTGIADADGNTNAGLSWGILVAETGSDFSTPFVTELGISTVDGSELADGLRFFNSGVTTLDLNFGNDPGFGAISTGTFDVSDFTPSFDEGDAFALIWFDRDFASGDTLQVGDTYGILDIPEFVVPTNGVTNFPFESNFSGSDPVRSADITVQAVPEPSSLVLGLLSGVALLRRRRC